jgi:hypothetical protein
MSARVLPAPKPRADRPPAIRVVRDATQHELGDRNLGDVDLR